MLLASEGVLAGERVYANAKEAARGVEDGVTSERKGDGINAESEGSKH